MSTESFRRGGEIPGDDLMERYVKALESIVNDHDQTSSQITEEYTQSLNALLLNDLSKENPGKQQATKFGELLYAPGSRLEQDTQYTKSSADTLFDASSKDFQAALSPEDQQVLKRASHTADTYGPGSHLVSNALAAASCRQARSAMQGLLPKPTLRERTEWNSAYDNTIFSEYYEMPGVNDLLRDFFRHRSSGTGPFGTQEGQQQKQGTAGENRRQREAPRQPREAPHQQANEEVERIVRVAVSKGRGESWLLNEDRTAIRRVINTVRAIRKKAQESGREATDRDIYIRYRRLVDQPEGEVRQEKILQSFQILQALMGGSPSGKLPF